MKREWIMEQELKDYQAFLAQLLKNNSSEIFTNGGKKHASILMEMLLQNTKDRIRMFATGLKPELITSEPYINEFRKLFTPENSVSNIQILVEVDDYINDEPFKIVRDAINSKINKHIEVKKITEEDNAIIGEELGYSPCNFSVFDETKFRLEYDPKAYKAFGSFNHGEWSKKLISLFDEVFARAKAIELN